LLQVGDLQGLPGAWLKQLHVGFAIFLGMLQNLSDLNELINKPFSHFYAVGRVGFYI